LQSDKVARIYTWFPKILCSILANSMLAKQQAHGTRFPENWFMLSKCPKIYGGYTGGKPEKSNQGKNYSIADTPKKP